MTDTLPAVTPELLDEIDAMPATSHCTSGGYLVSINKGKLAALAARIRELEAKASTSLFGLRDRVRKTKGSSWQGRVVGFYSTSLTPIGYCVESEREPGSVQLYPESALERVPEETIEDNKK